MSIDDSTIDLKDLIGRVKANDPALTSVALPSRQISNGNFKTLIHALRSNTVVKTLDLTSNSLNDEHISLMIAAFKNSDDYLAEETSDSLPKEKKSSAYYPIPYNVPLDINVTDTPPSSVHCHNKNTNNEKAPIGANDGDSTSRNLSRKNCHITNLILSDNEIGDDGAIILAEFLHVKNCSIKKLALTFNSIGSRGAIALASMLYSNCNTTLTVLSIGKNKFAFEKINKNFGIEGDTDVEKGTISGASALIRALTSNLTLRTLDMGYVNDETLISLRDMLMVNYTLKKLVVYGSSQDHKTLIERLLRINNNFSLEEAKKKKRDCALSSWSSSLVKKKNDRFFFNEESDEKYCCDIGIAIFLLLIIGIIVCITVFVLFKEKI
eukprot:CAMPEP_0194428336 /NCGR_PEP_ID=MMETSP0176-20130528/40444_1 /TAXON_ID=216777 /ORGANISM="Proboscia alata, Strain PI-D3" /LENGTH=380 /DNA_ID=CAMNT_0039240637 /DNA_START=326 /DNA_END=1468 /DNA_ORIENTATION=-